MNDDSFSRRVHHHLEKLLRSAKHNTIGAEFCNCLTINMVLNVLHKTFKPFYLMSVAWKGFNLDLGALRATHLSATMLSRHQHCPSKRKFILI
jgi:hypothetical protein